MNRKIAFLMDKGNRTNIFNDEHMKRLARIGDVVYFNKLGALSADDAAELIAGADIAVTSWGSPAFGPSILDQAPNLQLIMHAAGTVKPIMTPEVQRRGIRVGSSNPELGRRVAETALGLTIVSIKNVWQLIQDTRQGEWGRNRRRAKELYEVTIGVIGAGNTGKHYISLLRSFHVRILVFDPVLTEEQIRELGGVKADLEQLMRESDVVSIHAPSIPATNKMINAERLKWMKDDAVLINTARGSIIDEDALIAELKLGRLWACLDVTNPEPPSLDHPFRTLPNVTLIPHIAGVVTNGLRSLGEYVVSNVEAFAEGRPMEAEVNLGRLDSLA